MLVFVLVVLAPVNLCTHVYMHMCLYLSASLPSYTRVYVCTLVHEYLWFCLQVGIKNTEENRRLYRQLLITTPGIEEYISGVILYEESLSKLTDEGESFVSVLEAKGVVPGIKVSPTTAVADATAYTAAIAGFVVTVTTVCCCHIGALYDQMVLLLWLVLLLL